MSGCAGVTVIVDFHPGVREVCDANSGRPDAAALFTRNGWTLTQVSSTPGFVCRIDGRPAGGSCASTPPATAYWSLWVSAGPGKPWSYASLGPYSLTVPDGGSVAFSWDARPGDVPPSVAPGGVAPSAAASSAAPSSAATATAPGPTGGSGLPGWVAPTLVVLVLVAALVVALLRRRRA